MRAPQTEEQLKASRCWCGAEITMLERTLLERMTQGKTEAARMLSAHGLEPDPSQVETVALIYGTTLTCAEGHETPCDVDYVFPRREASAA